MFIEVQDVYKFLALSVRLGREQLRRIQLIASFDVLNSELICCVELVRQLVVDRLVEDLIAFALSQNICFCNTLRRMCLQVDNSNI